MTVTIQTGSYAAAADFVTATISNSTLVGAGSFSEEITDMMAGGYILDGITSDGTDWVAVLHKKYRKSF